MNLGAGQPASLSYGVELPSWYSNQYPYHSVQFSSPPQQWDLPFFSPDYHPPPPSYHPPPPPSYHLPPPPNPCPPPQHNYYAPPLQHFTQPQSYLPPQHNHSATLINGYLLPLQFPCASQTQAQYYPSPHSPPTHPIAPQPLTTTPQIPSYYTPHSNLRIHPPISLHSSHEPLVVHSHLWRARCKQVALKSTVTTGGVKKPSRFRPGTILPRKTANSQKRNQLLMRKPKFQRLLGAITQDVKTGLRLHSSYVEQPETMVKLKGSGTLLSPPSQVDNPLKLGSLPPMTTPELVTATIAVHTSVVTPSPTVASVKGSVLRTSLRPNLNLNHTDVNLGFVSEVGIESNGVTTSAISSGSDLSDEILGLNDDISTVMLSESSSEDNLAVDMSDKLSVERNNINVSMGNRESAIISTDGLVVKVISSRRLQDGREINELGSVTSRENTIVSSCSALVHSSKGIEGVRNASAPLFGSLVCAHLSTERNSSTIIPNFGILLQDSGGTHKLVGVRAKQDDQKTSLCGKSALHLFDEFSKSDGLCTAGKKIVANMSILDKERSVVKTDCGDSSKMNSLGQGTKPSSNSSNAKLLPPNWLSNVVSILETILQNGDTSWVFGERKGLEAVMQSFILPSMPLYVSVGQSISVVSSLVDMYAHCGTLMNAYMYNSAGNKSLSFWTIMINLFGMHGQNLFKRLLLDQKSVLDYLTSLVQVFDINGQMETDKGLANNSEEICLLIAILIIQLHLNEGIEICKESDVIIGSALEFEKLWKTGTGSSVCSFVNQKSLASSLQRHLSDNLSQLVEKTSSNLEIVSLIQQCLSRRFLSGEVADFIKSNPELSFMRYSADSLHSRDYDLFYMRNIKAPKQIMEALSSSANGKAVKEYTNIRIRDVALDTQSLALGFELLFASLSFIKVARMEMFGNVLNQGVNYKDIIVSKARNQGHKLHDQVFEFSFQLNHANACALSSNYGNGEIRRLVQGTNETCSAHAHAHAIIRMGKADFSLEEIEQLLFLNVNFQFIEATWASKLDGDSLVIMGGDLYRPVTIDQLAILRIQMSWYGAVDATLAMSLEYELEEKFLLDYDSVSET